MESCSVSVNKQKVSQTDFVCGAVESLVCVMIHLGPNAVGTKRLKNLGNIPLKLTLMAKPFLMNRNCALSVDAIEGQM